MRSKLHERPQALPGFTIVELIVVIVVIAVLAVIVIIAFNGIKDRAIISTLKSDLQGAATQLGMDNVSNGSYPASTAAANGGRGLKASSGTTYQYTYDSLTNAYCLSATSSSSTTAPGFNISSSTGKISDGVCSGHVAPGAPVGMTVTTFAGSGVEGFSDGIGMDVEFNYPVGIAVDSAGNVYVSDMMNHAIRKITPGGEVSTLAGSGSPGFTNDTGTAAEFNNPLGVAVDAAGNVYVGDTDNNAIRKITPAGVVTTLAGNGNLGFANGPGASAEFYSPRGPSVDSAGNVYVADHYVPRIRKITPAGVVSTLAGNGNEGTADGSPSTAEFWNPYATAVDSAGNVYVADRGSDRIRKVTSSGVVSTLAGATTGYADGTGSAARFNFPTGVAVDSAGNVYVSDHNNNRIRKISPAGVVITVAGSAASSYADGFGAAALFNNPIGVAVDGSGAVYVSDFANSRIRKLQ